MELYRNQSRLFPRVRCTQLLGANDTSVKHCLLSKPVQTRWRVAKATDVGRDVSSGVFCNPTDTRQSDRSHIQHNIGPCFCWLIVIDRFFEDVFVDLELYFC